MARSDEAGVSISAFVALKPGEKKSIIAMKRHCMTYLPHYMVPDTIAFVDGLPVTSTDKVNYQRLKSLTAGGKHVHKTTAAESPQLEVRLLRPDPPRAAVARAGAATVSWACWAAS